MSKRLFSTCRRLRHENPLGLPQPKERPIRRGELPRKRTIVGVQKVIAISSAKGGVGKSTIAANLALCFARRGYRAGILDTDIFGPSIPMLFNLLDAGEPFLTDKNQITPIINYGVKTMSMGYLIRPAHPVVWRGLMVSKAINQLLHEVDWGGLDVLILDLPPGTGDVQISIAQQVELAGAVVVSTPQDLALSDARKGLEMWKKTDVKVLGMVQNMSVFTCPSCGTETHVFGEGGVQKECEKLLIQMLGNVPLDKRVCDEADQGKPSVVADPESKRAEAFMGIAAKLEDITGLHLKGQQVFSTYETEGQDPQNEHGAVVRTYGTSEKEERPFRKTY